MDQNHQNLFMQQMQLNQMEMDRMMSTGIEFGGVNPDLNLNPTMLNEHMNQMNQMQNDAMNNFNNMNNNNMNNGGMFQGQSGDSIFFTILYIPFPLMF